MNLLTAENIEKSFTERKLLNGASFYLEEGEKVGIIGINGTGKSTLLKILAKIEEPDSGKVICANHVVMRYLPQNPVFLPEKTVLESVLEAAAGKQDTIYAGANAGGKHEINEKIWEMESSAKAFLTRLGITNFTQKTKELSGGQKTRVALGRLLVTKPDIILLDEPTNHLDMNSIAWLETYLMNYKGAVIIVSHDRYFLDRVVTKVIEVFQHRVSVFLGNYSDYAVKKKSAREALLRQYYNQQREIKHQEEVITKLKSFNREKSIKRAESREKMLDKMERLEKPVEDNTDIHITLEPNIVSGNDVMKVEGLAKQFDGNYLFSGIDFEIKRGERVALIGNNGTGKTTMLKIINGLIAPDGGEVRLGTNVHIGYYDQEHHVLHMEKTLVEEISDDYPYLNNTQIRNVLAAFLFTGDDVFKRIGDLSGGERGRVSLAKLMLSEANFLILDEPTNHLDITSKEILESALNQYTGTVFFVSHDRYFINQTATRILDLTGKTVINYIGNYDYYLEKREEQTALHVTAGQAEARVPEKTSAVKMDWEQQKKEQARIRKQENAIKKVEADIEAKEQAIAEIDEKLADPAIATNSAKLNELGSLRAKEQEALDELYEQWETLSSELG